eukprot:GHVL01034324.1.p1 GENE.GHVL01034324.1~~GHVL01034324.1.p1  ORF type:complete len:209 (-),score=22.46 GHVL01034324.1:36-662(-)
MTIKFLSPSYLIDKSGGGKRVITDFRTLNKRIIKQACKITKMTDIRTWAAGYAWKTKLDLSKAFYSLPVGPNSIPYLATMIGGVCYAYKRLPMGLQLSPGIFERTISHICTEYEKVGWMKHYLDDIIIIGDTKEQVTFRTETIEALLQESGFKVNPDKREMGQSITLGGVRVGGEHGRLPDSIMEDCSNCMELLKAVLLKVIDIYLYK